MKIVSFNLIQKQQGWNNFQIFSLPELTFIILDKRKLEDSGDELEALVGDTNIFLSRDDGKLCGEIEIMIAEEFARGKGFGLESTLIMLKYGIDKLKIDTYVAKIGLDNTKSIKMFEKLGFQEESRSSVFNELTLSRDCDEKWSSSLKDALGVSNLQIEPL